MPSGESQPSENEENEAGIHLPHVHQSLSSGFLSHILSAVVRQRSGLPMFSR